MSKVNISIDDDLIKRIDNYADSHYMSRSGLISIACDEYLSNREIWTILPDISVTLKKIADKGNVDHETMEKLEDFERFFKLFAPKM